MCVRKAVVVLAFFGFACASGRTAAPTEALVPLDHIGIADARFLNPKAPFALQYTPASIGVAIPTPLIFENRTGDRDLLVQIAFETVIELPAAMTAQMRARAAAAEGTIESRLDAVRTELERAIDRREDALAADLDDVDKLECDAANVRSAVIYPDTIIVPCTIRFKVGRGTPVAVPHGFIGELPEVFAFDVSFFEETEKPANSRGYVARVATAGAAPRAFKRDTKFELAPIGIIGVAHDPEIKHVGDDGKTAIITPDRPYRGDHRTHASAEGRVDVTGNYGNDVDAEVSFRYKKSDLGAEEGKTIAEASQYKLRIFLVNGLRSEFGKFRFSNPSDGIATNEFGEGLRLDIGSGLLSKAIGTPSISHIVKRESVSPVVDSNQGDRNTSIFEWKNLPIVKPGGARIGPFRTANLLALWGRDETPADDHSYQTFGGELFFIHRHALSGDAPVRAADRGYFSGSVAGYWSSRDAIDPVPSGAGHVYLAKVNYSPNLVVSDGKTSSPLTLGLVAGYGRADDPATPTEDEGYVGETQSFAPDVLFLSSLAKPLIEGEKTLAADARTGLRSGLSGKYYGAVRLTTDKSPLRWIAHLLKNDADVQSSATIVTLHNYWLHGDGTRHAASELDVNFQIVAPARVRMSVGFAFLLPGEATSDALDLPPWALTATLTIDPKL